MDGRKCALLYNKCFNHQMFWQPFYKIWCTGWFKDWYRVQLSVGGNGEVSRENGNRSPPQYTIIAESQWWSQAWEPFTLKSHENFPSRRERLAPGTEQVFVALSINKSQDNTCQPGWAVFWEEVNYQATRVCWSWRSEWCRIATSKGSRYREETEGTTVCWRKKSC